MRRKVKTATGKRRTKLAAHEQFRQLGNITRGWVLYFRHGASKTAFLDLHNHLWWRTWTWLRKKHPDRNKKWIVRRYYPHGWWPEANGVTLYKPASMRITRHRYRGNRIPTPWTRTTRTATT